MASSVFCTAPRGGSFPRINPRRLIRIADLDDLRPPQPEILSLKVATFKGGKSTSGDATRFGGAALRALFGVSAAVFLASRDSPRAKRRKEPCLFLSPQTQLACRASTLFTSTLLQTAPTEAGG